MSSVKSQSDKTGGMIPVYNTIPSVWASLRASTSFTDDFDHTLLHRRRVQAAVGTAPHYLIQQEVNKVLVGNEAPQVHLQVVAVHLDLLQPVTAKYSQADALQECF